MQPARDIEESGDAKGKVENGIDACDCDCDRTPATFFLVNKAALLFLSDQLEINAGCGLSYRVDSAVALEVGFVIGGTCF